MFPINKIFAANMMGRRPTPASYPMGPSLAASAPRAPRTAISHYRGDPRRAKWDAAVPSGVPIVVALGENPDRALIEIVNEGRSPILASTDPDPAEGVTIRPGESRRFDGAANAWFFGVGPAGPTLAFDREYHFVLIQSYSG